MNKKVLITVSGGVSTAFADQGVDVVIIDFDDAKDSDPNDLIPINSSFLPLMKFAQASNAWPVSDDGLINDAYNIESSEVDEVDGEVTLRFKPLTDLDLPPLGAPVFCLLKPCHVKNLVGNKPIILFLTTHNFFCGSGLPFIVQPEDIDQWALVPASLGGCHAA